MFRCLDESTILLNKLVSSKHTAFSNENIFLIVSHRSLYSINLLVALFKSEE